MGALVPLIIVLPLVELLLLVRVGRVVGFAPIVGLVIAMGVLGVVALRSQGRRVLRQWQEAVAQGRVPEEGIVGGMLALLAGMLLIMPGLLTDGIGLALLVPALRKSVARALSAYLQRQLSLGRLRVYGFGTPRSAAPPETEVGRARYGADDVIDTQGEEVK